MIFSRLFSKRGAGADAGVISHDELANAVKAKTCIVVDVREPGEFSSGRVPGAVNHPLSRFDPTRLPAGKPVVLICRSGARSASALSKARAAGRQDVRHYAGGIIGWHRSGGDVHK
jgi:rhodanese-related sulfurtransferase